jgi:hypothetical protein
MFFWTSPTYPECRPSLGAIGSMSRNSDGRHKKKGGGEYQKEIILAYTQKKAKGHCDTLKRIIMFSSDVVNRREYLLVHTATTSNN